jgi:hypothetical protein
MQSPAELMRKLQVILGNCAMPEQLLDIAGCACAEWDMDQGNEQKR